ncbi:hypothetical protein [Nonomuraea recticatena]|uniref:hypothetical protein n=1 Tax=Nonomuraea recticatena TaxID=46178 RepID=UPI003609A2F6
MEISLACAPSCRSRSILRSSAACASASSLTRVSGCRSRSARRAWALVARWPKPAASDTMASIDSDRVSVTAIEVSIMRRVQITPSAESITTTPSRAAGPVTPCTNSQATSRRSPGSDPASLRAAASTLRRANGNASSSASAATPVAAFVNSLTSEE